MKYYKAGKEVANLLEELATHEKSLVAEGLRISRRLGASRTSLITCRGIFGDLSIAGFKFSKKKKVDTKLFKEIKHLDSAWEPRLSIKAGKQLKEVMKIPTKSHFQHICKTINMKQFRGCSVRIPGITKHGKFWYISAPDDVKVKGCTRISDIQYEKARDKTFV